MRLRRKGFRGRVALAFCAALFALAPAARPPRHAAAQQKTRGSSPSGDMRCVSYCSRTKPGAVLMEVSLPVAERPLSDAELRPTLLGRSLDVTVYSAEGFERGLYATLPALRPSEAFLSLGRDGRGAAPARVRSKIPGLGKLVVSEVATRLDAPGDSFLLARPESDPQALREEGPADESVMLRIEGLEPGLAYTFRVPGGQAVVTCQSAYCPTDRVPARPRRGARARP